MITRTTLLLVATLACAAAPASAQNFLMNSAETINEGNFKIAAFPTVLLGKDGFENEWGLATRLGYGFTDSFDVEAKLAFFDGLKSYGVDAEYWLVRGRTDVSVGAGLRRSDYAGGLASTAIDAALLASRNLGSRLEVYGGLSVSFESVDDGSDSNTTGLYVVPGVEYKLSDDVDLLAEVGLGLNEEARNYLSLGVALYLR